MGAKIFFKNSPSVDEIMLKAKQLGVRLGAEQEGFIKRHATHGGLTLQDHKVSCRTCKVSV